MDALDREVLLALQEDGRMSNLALARKLGLSPSAMLGRVRRLERSGAIRGYRAIIDPAALGVTVRALVDKSFGPAPMNPMVPGKPMLANPVSKKNAASIGVWS